MHTYIYYIHYFVEERKEKANPGNESGKTKQNELAQKRSGKVYPDSTNNKNNPPSRPTKIKIIYARF